MVIARSKIILCFLCLFVANSFLCLLWLKMNYAAADADSDGLGAIGGAQFFHDVLDVDLDRLFGDEESLRDVTIAIAVSHFAQHFDFTLRQHFITHVLEQL